MVRVDVVVVILERFMGWREGGGAKGVWMCVFSVSF